MERTSDATATRYANALFEIGVDHDQVEGFLGELEALTDALQESVDFRNLLFHPGIDVDERREAVRNLADRWGLDEKVRNFIYVLLDNERIRKLPAITAIYRDLVDEKEGNVRATVTSADELDEKQKRAIANAFAEKTGKNIILRTEVDPSLIGGAVARIGGKVFDGSVHNQFEQLKENILKEV